jgi:crotonobetainyl-CoA:carnitine CoA-transferase CaiB-like acyl-CoA transferase
MQDRDRNRDALIERLVAMVERDARAYWLEALEKAGVPCGPIDDVGQTFDNPYRPMACRSPSIGMTPARSSWSRIR